MEVLENLGYFNDMGIGFLHEGYIEVSNNQNKEEELIKIKEFLSNYLKYYSIINNIPLETLKLDFINYGKTQLVFVLSSKLKREALLVKQPAARFGIVRDEMDNLIHLNIYDDHVIAPYSYYSFDEQELYVSEYINKARCIACLDKWGMYAPDPYRFIPFSVVQESMVNACMIAKLISYYDFVNEEGLASCHLGGGDFMLNEYFEHRIPVVNTTLNNMYLIAARKKIKVPFNEYIDMIKYEFTKSTILEDENDIKINIRCRVPMKEKDIENGIILGNSLIRSRVRR